MDFNYINTYFPKIELSYEQVHHKKVPNLYIAIPQGKKIYLWFTHFKNEDVCYTIEYNTKFKKITNYKKCTMFFDKKLSYGTVLHGTNVTINKTQYFVTENIMYFCGKNTTHFSYKDKLAIYDDMFNSYIKQTAYSRNELIVTLCLMHKNKEELMKLINNENYNMYGVLSRNINNNYSYMLPLNRNVSNNRLLNFRVMADTKCNVYNLYIHDHINGIQFYQKTYIPDYKTTVLLNDKFRSIKENANLDLLEESDDEEEFENINEDKFVYLDRFFNFKCYFHPKIKKWVPKEYSNDKRIVNSNDLK